MFQSVQSVHPECGNADLSSGIDVDRGVVEERDSVDETPRSWTTCS